MDLKKKVSTEEDVLGFPLFSFYSTALGQSQNLSESQVALLWQDRGRLEGTLKPHPAPWNFDSTGIILRLLRDSMQ